MREEQRGGSPVKGGLEGWLCLSLRFFICLMEEAGRDGSRAKVHPSPTEPQLWHAREKLTIPTMVSAKSISQAGAKETGEAPCVPEESPALSCHPSHFGLSILGSLTGSVGAVGTPISTPVPWRLPWALPEMGSPCLKGKMEGGLG